MTDEQKQTAENSKAISELTAIVKKTSGDVDRLINHMDKLIPVNEMITNLSEKVDEIKKELGDGIRPKMLKNILSGTSLILITFFTWIVINIFELKTDVSTHVLLDSEIGKEVEIKMLDFKAAIQQNKNQIVYLKGAKKDK